MSPSDTNLSRRLHFERTAVELLYRALTEKDPELVDTVLTSDWVDQPLAPGQRPGPEGIKPIIRSLGQALPDMHVTLHDVVQAPGKIAVRGEISGTHQGEFFGIAPTGKRVSFRLHDFHALDGQRVTRTWHMEDWFGFFLQLGQFPTND